MTSVSLKQKKKQKLLYLDKINSGGQIMKSNKAFKLIALLALFMTGCEKTPEHVHTYSSEWSYTEEYHWHAATCEHTDQVSEKATHTFVKGEVVAPTTEERGYTIYTCSVCNYSKNSDYVDPIDPYKDRIKSKDFRVINISYERQNANDPRFFEDSKPLTNYLKEDTYKMYYLDQLDDVFYLPLSTFANLYKGDFKDGVVNTFNEGNGISTWTSTLGKETYTLSIDKNLQTISTKGSLEDFFKSVPNGRIGVFEQASIVTTYAEGHEEKLKTFYFGDYDFDIFEADGKLCFPFALIACETSKYVERTFLNASYYNYLLEYAAPEQYAEFFYLDENNQEKKFIDLVSGSFKQLYGVDDGHGDKVVVAPKTLTEFNKKIIYYLFANYYGLASTRGIKSMTDYLDNLVESKDFTNGDGVLRASAYYHALQGMNDLHTGYGSSAVMNEGNNDDAICDQSFYRDRNNMTALLNGMREQEINKYNEAKSENLRAQDVRYSEDGLYAYFSFDTFMTYHYFEQGEIPESDLIADPYFLFIRNLNEIKAKGTVKRVFIDDSLNGGGYVAIMGKLLALLSKDNKSVMYLRDQSDNSIQTITTRVDSNKDGKYDEKDCYGNDFEFYIITSPCSFSCGNAFPFYVEKNGFGKIVGMRSGGGECCVFGYTLPTGQSINYSSPYHIGQYYAQTDKFEGDEVGGHESIALSSGYNMYNVDSLAAFATARNPFK